MSLPYGMTIDRLAELFDDLHKCIKTSFDEFNEREFIKTFVIEDNFIFNFRRFYHMDELILTAYLKHGIEMEYNEILKDSEGNELSFNQCQKLVRWFLADDSINSNESWIPMKTANPDLNLNNSIYDLFRNHIRENICPELSVKSKFEKRIENSSYIYYVFIGLQASKGVPIGFTELKLKIQARHKYLDYIDQYNRETKAIKAWNEKISKSSILCKNFLIKVGKKYKDPTKEFMKARIGKLIDEFTIHGLTYPTEVASKLSEQIYNKVMNGF